MLVQEHDAIFMWSGGKDSALCLYKCLQRRGLNIFILLTTLNKQFDRISMHGTHESLLDEQVKSIGMNLDKMWVEKGTNKEYEDELKQKLLQYKSNGIDQVIFGDINLEDLRVYREKLLSKMGMKAVFPLWDMDTRKLADEFIDLGFRAIVCAVSTDKLDESFVGVEYDERFLKSLPADVDPCGENGEFHTFVYDGPAFKYPLSILTGEKVYRKMASPTVDHDNASNEASAKLDDNDRETDIGFWYADITLTGNNY